MIAIFASQRGTLEPICHQRVSVGHARQRRLLQSTGKENIDCALPVVADAMVPYRRPIWWQRPKLIVSGNFKGCDFPGVLVLVLLARAGSTRLPVARNRNKSRSIEEISRMCSGAQ
jgi:hypothetical protein